MAGKKRNHSLDGKLVHVYSDIYKIKYSKEKI